MERRAGGRPARPDRPAHGPPSENGSRRMEPPPPAPQTGSRTAQFVGFELADQAYAFRIDRIREIVMPSRVAQLPDVPAYVDGVSNLRGTIIPIINLRALFGLPRRDIDADARTIVVAVGPRIMGCLVDSVSRVMRIAGDQIQPPPEAVAGVGRGAITGIARDGDSLRIILDVDMLLDPAHLDDVHRAGIPQISARPAPSGTP